MYSKSNKNLHVLPKRAITMKNASGNDFAENGAKKVVESVRVFSRDNVDGVQH